MDAMQKDCATKYYEEHKNLICSIVHRFIRQHHGIGLNFEEQLSIAHLYFVEKIVPKYDQRYAFSTWLINQLPYYLHNNYYRKEKPEEHERLYITETAEAKQQTMFFDLLDELKTDDAKHIATLIVKTPSDLQQLIEDMGGSMFKIKNVLLKYLKQNGWKTKRINHAFTQIETALL